MSIRIQRHGLGDEENKLKKNEIKNIYRNRPRLFSGTEEVPLIHLTMHRYLAKVWGNFPLFPFRWTYDVIETYQLLY